MNDSKRAIIFTLGDIMVDYDAPYIAVVPKVFKEIFGEYVGQEYLGVPLNVPDEDMIREIVCSGKSLADILDHCLYMMNRSNDAPVVIDTRDVLAEFLGVSESSYGQACFWNDEGAVVRQFMPAAVSTKYQTGAYSDDEKDEIVLKAYEAYQFQRDSDIELALERHTQRMAQDVKTHIEDHGPFIEGTVDTVNELINTGCDVKVLYVWDEKRDFPHNLVKSLVTKTNLVESDVETRSIRALEGKDVKDIFPTFEYFDEGNIFVCSNHVGFLSRSTGLDFLRIDRLFAEFDDPIKGGFSRLKDAPYHVCMVDYNKSMKGDYVPSTIRDEQVMRAATPNQLLSCARLFAEGHFAHSFAERPETGKDAGGNATVISFPKQD